MLPGQAHIGEQWPSQPQLPASGGDQTRPSVGGRRVARTDGGPAERLFKEAEGVFHREAPQVPTPEDAQVGREWTADPGQPQGPRGQLLVRQAFHLDAHDAERAIRGAGDIDLDFAVRGMGQSLRELGQAVGLGIRQPKRLAMQARPTSTSVLLMRMSIDHAVFAKRTRRSASTLLRARVSKS
jgi:hypothetical protein